MMRQLEELRDALAVIPQVTTCKVGLEESMRPDDYPMVRIVPGRIEVGPLMDDDDVRKCDVTVYFGIPLQPFDDTPDSAGRVRLEKSYAALFALEDAIIAALSVPITDILSLTHIDTITDEDRLETYKLMAIRLEVVR